MPATVDRSHRTHRHSHPGLDNGGNVLNQERQLAAVLEPLYAAALQPERMAEFSAALCAATGSHVGAVMVHDSGHGQGRLDLLVGADPAQAALYEQEFAGDNLWMQRGQHRMAAGTVMDSDTVATRTELRRTRYYNEYLKQGDVEQSLAMCAKADAEGVVVATLCRSGSLQPYSRRQLALVQAVAPHWVNAYAIQRRLSLLEQRIETLEKAVEVSPLAMVTLDESQRVSRMNPVAEQLFRDGQAVHLNHGRPEAAFAPLQLRKAIQEAVVGCHTDGRQRRAAAKVILQDAAGRSVLVTSVHPLAASDRTGQRAAILFLQPLAGGRALTVDLRQLFGLTAAEAALACALHRQGDLAQAAEHCEIALTTAQTRIKLIYDKTGERGLPALMRLLAVVAMTSN